MSLRRELHAAYDELGPQDAGLSERVVNTVDRDGPRRAAWSLRMRAPLSLVAVFVVIAVIAGALVGGRLIADWRSLSAPRVPAAPQTPLQKLEARPLHLPTLHSATECVYGPWGTSGDLGTGPLHWSGSAVEIRTAWGSYFHEFLYADGAVTGPILVRARDLIHGQRVVFVGQYAGGPVVGTDVLDGNVVVQHLELVIDSVTPPYAWQIEDGSANGTGCTGWQIDGPGFTETFTL